MYASALHGAGYVALSCKLYPIKGAADRGKNEPDEVLGHTRVAGPSPLLLCGLALSGANQGADASGRVPGIITAEELMALDLTHC